MARITCSLHHTIPSTPMGQSKALSTRPQIRLVNVKACPQLGQDGDAAKVERVRLEECVNISWQRFGRGISRIARKVAPLRLGRLLTLTGKAILVACCCAHVYQPPEILLRIETCSKVMPHTRPSSASSCLAPPSFHEA